jgi:hypothetical protein
MPNLSFLGLLAECLMLLLRHNPPSSLLVDVGCLGSISYMNVLSRFFVCLANAFTIVCWFDGV